MTGTVLDGIAARLNASLEYNPNVYDAPVALLWPDEAAQWPPVIDRLKATLPIVSLGEYTPDTRRGPAYWVRCVVGGTVDAGLTDRPAIVYLPGVSRSALRAIDRCPSHLAPIAELQYRGQWFSHPNNRDWTVRALLSHAERGLGLQIADDGETSRALLLALGRLLDEHVDRLSTQVLDADYLHSLINPDPVSHLLRWLDDPHSYRCRFDEGEWAAFVQQCKANYGFDPTLEGEVTGALKLGGRQGGWVNVWKRFVETPNRYPGIAEQLRKARPDQLIVDNFDAWPQDNETMEDQLRSRLRDFEALTPEGARTETALLDAEHAWRRTSVWADLGKAPLAFALEQLTFLADVTAQPVASTALASLIADYTERGWRADDAVVRALAAADDKADRGAVSAAVEAMYRPWLDAAARSLQMIIGPMVNAGTYVPGPAASSAKGILTVFVDGLRLDVAHRVRERLASMGLRIDVSTTLTALPAVTQTGKPALAPVGRGALVAGPELHAANAATGTRASIEVLRSLMSENGVQVLGPTEIGDPTGAGWTESGEVDHRGHDMGIRMVDYLDDEVDRLVGRIRELIDAGWKQVDIVTDHGWLLVPGCMPKTELPPATSVIKKGRCARLKDGAVVEVPTVPWFWDQDVRIALAPGISCFEANKEYEHGGVSPQECIVPRLSVTVGTSAATTGGPEITRVKWLGLLCRIELAGIGEGAIVDLRALPADPKTSIAEEAKETTSAGRVSLVVPEEEHEGERAHLVLVAPDGRILAQREVVVGRNR